MSGVVDDLKQIYDKCVKDIWESKKGKFYMFEIQPKHLPEYYKYCLENSKLYKIVRVKPDISQTHGEVFSITAYTDLDLEVAKHRRFVYTFKVLFYRERKNLNQIAKSILSPEQMIQLKVGIGDTGRNTKFQFICRLDKKIFVYLDKKIMWFDLEKGKARSYWDSKQKGLFSDNQIDIEDVIFFEKFIYKSLDIK